MEWLQSIALGVIGSLVASALYLAVMLSLRPRLGVSSVITRTPTDNGAPTFRYRVKIVNKSRRDCVDFLVRAYLITEWTIPGARDGEFGVNRVFKPINLSRREGGPLPGYRRSDRAGSYAVRIRFEESAVQVLNAAEQNQYILLRVSAKDGVSGFPGTVSREYRLATQISNGTFAFGRSMKVVEWLPPSPAPLPLTA